MLPVGAVSAYDVRVATVELVPDAGEAARAIAEVEASHPTPAHVQRAIEGWRRPAG